MLTGRLGPGQEGRRLLVPEGTVQKKAREEIEKNIEQVRSQG